MIPEAGLQPLLLGPGAGADGGGVVAAALGVPRAALDSPDVLVLHVDAHGIEALLVVGPYRTADDAEQVGVGRVNPHGGVGGDDEGPDDPSVGEGRWR